MTTKRITLQARSSDESQTQRDNRFIVFRWISALFKERGKGYTSQQRIIENSKQSSYIYKLFPGTNSEKREAQTEQG